MTMNQLTRVSSPLKRKVKRHKTTVPALQGCPQKLGVCSKVFTMSPKKPNSAVRKVARIRLGFSKRYLTAAISGCGHSLQEHAVVLVRGGRANDLPGVRYKLIRGKYDFNMEERIDRGSRRSKFGVSLNREKNV